MRSEGYFGVAQAAWASDRSSRGGNAARFIAAPEAIEIPIKDFTIVRRSWFDGSLSHREIGALLCVAAKLDGPNVYLSDVAQFLRCSERTASLRLKPLLERGMVECLERDVTGRFCERSFKLIGFAAKKPVVDHSVVSDQAHILNTPFDEELLNTKTRNFDQAYASRAGDSVVLQSEGSTQAEQLATAHPEVGDLVQWTKDGEELLSRPSRVTQVREAGPGRMITVEGRTEQIPAQEVFIVKSAGLADDEEDNAFWESNIFGWTQELPDRLREAGLDLLDVDENLVSDMLVWEEWFRYALRKATQGRISGCLLSRPGLKAFLWLAAFVYKASDEGCFSAACATILNAVHDGVGRRPPRHLSSWRLIGERLLWERIRFGIASYTQLFEATGDPMFSVIDGRLCIQRTGDTHQ